MGDGAPLVFKLKIRERAKERTHPACMSDWLKLVPENQRFV
jgi:hypothetical protein